MGDGEGDPVCEDDGDEEGDVVGGFVGEEFDVGLGEEVDVLST